MTELDIYKLHQQEVKKDKLQALYRSSSLGGRILSEFSGRKSRFVKVDDIRTRLCRLTGIPPEVKSVLDVLRELEQLKWGRLILGRRGHDTRFECEIDLDEIWRLAVGNDSLEAANDRSGVAHLSSEDEAEQDVNEWEEGIEEGAEDGDLPSSDADSPAALDPGEMLRHTFTLRPDLQITLSLPANLTGTEAERLGKFIGTLPFC